MRWVDYNTLKMVTNFDVLKNGDWGKRSFLCNTVAPFCYNILTLPTFTFSFIIVVYPWITTKTLSHCNGGRCMGGAMLYSWVSPTWATAMFFNESKRKRFHTNRVQFPEDWSGHQHVGRLFAWGHQHGGRDVMWKLRIIFCFVPQ